MVSCVKGAIADASAGWISCLNNSDAAGCASYYEDDATVFSVPFGSFRGRAQIEGFWARLIKDGFSIIEYIDPKIKVIDHRLAVLTSTWATNKAPGVITRGLWALQPGGTALLKDDCFVALGWDGTGGGAIERNARMLTAGRIQPQTEQIDFTLPQPRLWF